MKQKKELLNDAKLYLILDHDVCEYDKLFEIARESIDFGVDVLQLRDKHGKPEDIVWFSRRIQAMNSSRVLYLINDRADLVRECLADGVHLGQEDLPVAQAREFLSDGHLIGVSCQNIQHIVSAQEQGADYIGFGSVFKTKTKPQREPMDLGLLQKAVQLARIPLFAIGGINTENIEILRGLAVERVAVCRDLCCAEDVGGQTRILKLKISGTEIMRG